MTPTPELDKIKALDGANDTIGDFIEWLREHGYVIARYGAPYEVYAYINTNDVDDQEIIERIWAIKRQVNNGVPVGEDELAWLTEYAVENDLVRWHSEFGKPGGAGVWGNEVFLGESENPTFRWAKQRTNDEALFDPAISTEKLLAEYFDIDLRKVSDEKDAVYKELQAAVQGRAG